jgi:cell division transport system permease protein
MVKRMNNNIVRYYLRDAKLGISRNPLASIAIFFFIFLSLTVCSAVVLFKLEAVHFISYLKTQDTIKLIVKEEANADHLASVLSKNPYIKTVTLESKQESLERFQSYFQDKPELFESFSTSSFPDIISITVKNQNQTTLVASELASITDIDEVVFAQKYSESLAKWSRLFDRYGLLLIFVFILSAIFAIVVSAKVSLMNRKQEIQIKLLLGANRAHIHLQLLIESVVLGFMASMLSMYVIVFCYRKFFTTINALLPNLQLDISLPFGFAILALCAGVMLSISSYLIATYKWVKHA